MNKRKPIGCFLLPIWLVVVGVIMYCNYIASTQTIIYTMVGGSQPPGKVLTANGDVRLPNGKVIKWQQKVKR